MRPKPSLAILLCVAPVLALAQTADLEFEAEAGVTSADIRRGRVLNDEFCLQPSATARRGGLALNVWGTWNLTAGGEDGSERIATTLSADATRARQTVATGVIAYNYLDEAGPPSEDTVEVFFNYALDVPSLPSLTIYYDCGEFDGFYASLALSHSVELPAQRAALDLQAAVGAGDEEYARTLFSFPADEAAGLAAFEPDGASLLDLTLDAALPVKLTDRIVLTPAVRHMIVLDSDIRRAADDAGEDTDATAFRLALSARF